MTTHRLRLPGRFRTGTYCLVAGAALLLSGACRRPAGSERAAQPGSNGAGAVEPSGARPAAKAAYASPEAAAAAIGASAEFQSVSDKKAFDELLALPDFRAVVSTPGFADVAGNRDFATLIGNSSFQALVAEQAFAAVANDSAAAMGIARGTASQVATTLNTAALGQEIPRRFASSAEFAYLLNSCPPFRALAPKPHFLTMAADANFRTLMTEPGFGRTVAFSQQAFVAMLRNPQFRKTITNGDLARLCSLPAFQYLAANNAIDRLISAPDGGKR
jgi:hypothetical protein